MQRPLVLSFLLAGFFACTLTPCQAAVTNWTVQSASSALTLSGNLSSGGSFLANIFGQTGINGGLSTSYSGTVMTQQSATEIEILSAALDANNSGTWDPLPGGTTGTAPGEYGHTVQIGFFSGSYQSIRDLVISLSSGPIPLLGSPPSMQSFTGAIDATIAAGAMDFRGYGALGAAIGTGTRSDFVGASDSSVAVGNINYTFIPGTAILAIPIELQFESILLGADTTDTVDDIGLYMTLFGSIVATAPAESVPEASSLILLGLAGSVVGFLGYRRNRNF